MSIYEDFTEMENFINNKFKNFTYTLSGNILNYKTDISNIDISNSAFINALWPLFCFLHWCYANYLLLKIFFISIKNLFVKKKDADLYFFQIQKNNTPFFFIKDSDRKSYDLISWFQNFYSKQGVPIQNINHDNKSITNIVYENFEISYCAPPFFFIKDIFKIVKFFFISLFLFSNSLLFLFLTRPP